ncbi:uncharacterized protein LOC124887879 [Capsicum annuum]|uniref:uncharacterized protein LOC124887879 n=1 Tax=Capsicum annuum TaxID=4072 RepID=UPI001FB148AE|nr:uncharacterized protein LOC124887879 [Capsicum annuum]
MADPQEVGRLATLARAQLNQQNIDNPGRVPNPDEEDLGDDDLLGPGNRRCAKDIVASVDRNKKTDPGAFTIPCTIGSLDFTKALCDLGANINLMPLVVFKKQGLGDPTPTNMSLVMEDRSVKWTIGVLHDVLVNLADFIFPANFLILDCEVDFEVPIILGRPFLATKRVLVDIELNELKFRLNGKEVSFEVHQSMRQKKEISVFSIIDVFYEDGRDTPAELGMKHFLDPPKEVKR